ncbi:molybdopterin-dependent oxidoreductase [Desulfoluna spongiiphila]|uniref:molybdopterin-dependent oxidoreductase n=1 Tax=Desulfoluna spongiiphila TaxID=419481 RepID=UPI0012570F58|nr:molybdopterin-dependent oxidoreductase [Desulfoluna spongiiphila]VVS91641.1 molybdopterin oxidoreductase [Desulfoluna spongiiphila]
MGEWKKTGCVLCAQNCGLEVQTEGHRIVKVRADKENVRSRGYMCRKGANVAFHQNHEGRLTQPLKRTEDGFQEISWEQAFSEIGSRLRGIVDEHGPKSYAYMGGGGQGCHFEAAFGMTLMKAVGSKYSYNALGQELTGYFWACGRMMGRQNRFAIPDEHHAEMILGIGWNGMESHQMPRAPLVLKEFSKNPDKFLAIIDPRKSETARVANLHIPVRPGTDALLARAMIALILEKGWEKRDYLEAYCTGFADIEPWFRGFDIQAALSVCEVSYEDVYALCEKLVTLSWCMHFDLGIYMNRHSTLTSYLYMLLASVCGRSGVAGGNVIPGTIVPLGSHTDERDEKNWRTVETGFPALNGAYPPNVMPEEILSDHPERLRAVLCSGSNPLRSYADTTAYEEAFKKLDLLVVSELAMTETAELAHYVLPAKSGYESYDGTFFPWNYPEVYFQMRHPMVTPKGDPKEVGEIYTGIAEAAGYIPEIPAYVYEATQKDRKTFAAALFSFASKNKKAMKVLPFVLAKTLGEELGSANLAALWGITLAMPKSNRKNAARAGFPLPRLWQTALNPANLAKALAGMVRHGAVAPVALLTPQIAQSEAVFQAIVDHPGGLWVGKMDLDGNLAEIRHPDGKMHLHIPEMDAWVKTVTPEAEAAALKMTEEAPLVLMAGRHTAQNSNTLMRDPAWNEGRRACTLAMHPGDAERFNLTDGQMVKIITEAASEVIELEVTDHMRKGQVAIPHGFGLTHNGEVFGVNVNRLTKNTHRDSFAATPLHRFVPCRVEGL